MWGGGLAGAGHWKAEPHFPGPGDFMREPKVYEDLTDLAVLKAAMETALREYNLSPAVVPMQLVLFREAIEHSERPLPHPGPAPQRLAVPKQVREAAFLSGPRWLFLHGGGCSNWLQASAFPHTSQSLSFSFRRPGH